MAYISVTTQADVVDPSDGQLSLREAVAQANATTTADTVRFIATLQGETLVLAGGELAVTQDLTIDGDRDHDGNVVTLDGNANGRILNISGADTDVTINNMTLRNGAVNSSDNNGGAILSVGRSLLLVGATIENSRADSGGGGAIYAGNGSKVTIVDCSIVGNYAGGYGVGGGGGGGLSTGTGSTINIRDSHLVNNSSEWHGGGIFVGNGGSTTIENSSIIGNRAGYGGQGGGIGLYGGSASISRSTISGNQAPYGGGVCSNRSKLTVTNSTVAANLAGYAEYSTIGVGIAVAGNLLAVKNSVLTGNSGEGGSIGAVDVAGTRLNIT